MWINPIENIQDLVRTNIELNQVTDSSFVCSRSDPKVNFCWFFNTLTLIALSDMFHFETQWLIKLAKWCSNFPEWTTL